MFGWRSTKPATTSSSRHVDGALNVPSATLPAAHPGELPDARGRILQRAQALRRVLGERVPGLGRDDTAPGADEQVGAERALELADLLRHRGLRDPQGLRRGAERAELQRRAEAAHLLE